MNKWTIRARLTVLTTAFILFLAAIGGFGVYTSRHLSENIKKVAYEKLPTMRSLVLIDMVHDGTRAAVLDGMYGAAINSEEHISAAAKDLESLKDDAKKNFDEIKKYDMSIGFAERYKKATLDLQTYLSSATKVIASATERQKPLVLNEQFKTFEENFEHLEKSLDEMGAYFEQENKTQFAAVVDQAAFWQSIALFGLFGSVAFLLVFSLIIGKSIVSTLKAVSNSLTDGANELGFAITQLASASNNLSNSAQDQASALQQTSASSEEIASMVKKAADEATLAQEASSNSKGQAEKGQVAIEEMVSAINEINTNNDAVLNAVNAGNTRISEIVDVIQEIGNKTKVINEIVFQTKLLSFNASVEAARAGEHGKGFAVVAEEVGNLASMSGNAAKEITGLLEQSMSRVQGIVQETKSSVESLMNEARHTVERGSSVARECSNILSEIVNGATHMSEMVASIAHASQEQATGVDEITKAISQLNVANQINATAANDCSSTTEKLSVQAQGLRDASTALKQIVEGGVAVNKFVWKDEYSLKIPAMDGEHKVLIERINSLVDAIRESNGKASKDVKSCFADLASFTIEHFSHEEAYMASIDYPQLTGHKEIHKKLLATVGEYQGKIESGNFNASELVNFLNDWLLKHILNVDMKYSRYAHTHDSSHLSSSRRAA